MPGDVDHVVSAAEDEVVTVGIADAPVEGRIHLLAEVGPVGIDEALVVAIHGLHAARRQWSFNHHHALLVGPAQLAGGFIDDVHLVAVQWYAGTAQPGRLVVDALGDRQDRPAAFGLPIVVDHRHAERTGNPV